VENLNINDFTEAAYRENLKALSLKWECISFYKAKEEFIGNKNVCLLRHDVDISVQRAHRIAQLEHEAGVKSTYFVFLRSDFYNVFEEENTRLLKAILTFGHDIGLHFYPHSYGLIKETNPEFSKKSKAALEKFLSFEKEILERLLDIEIRSFSFHSPDTGGWIYETDESICGMINTYNPFIRQTFSYCSDSNGYWRFKRLPDFICNETSSRIQILTHPEWWVEQPLLPDERIRRAVFGRAAKTLQKWDNFLRETGRKE
jgi:predicted hydrocarbon binding protein